MRGVMDGSAHCHPVKQDVPSKLAPFLADARKKWLGGEKSREPRAEKQKLIANGFSSKYLGHRMPDYPMLTGFTQC